MQMKLADTVGRTLADVAEREPRVFVLDGDLADSDGAIHFAQQHPQRFLMAGIAEQGMVSTAAGMAEAGLRPWVFSFAAFLCYRAFDQVRICLSQSKQPVTLVGSHAGGLAGRNGKTHAAPNDLALMLSLPNIAIWAPADHHDVRLAIAAILAGDTPAYIRTPRARFDDNDNLPGEPSPMRWIAPKRPTTIVATGLATRWAFDAVKALAADGVQVGLLHVPCLRPLPAVERALDGVETIIVVEDHSRFGGLASLLSMRLPQRPLYNFGWPVDFCGKSGPDETLLLHYGLDGASLATAIGTLESRRTVPEPEQENV